VSSTCRPIPPRKTPCFMSPPEQRREEYTDRQRSRHDGPVYRRWILPRASVPDPDAICERDSPVPGATPCAGEPGSEGGDSSRYVTLARNHPRGRKAQSTPTAGGSLHRRAVARLRSHGPPDLGGAWRKLADPSPRIGRFIAPGRAFQGPRYHLYCSSFFYERITRFCRRESLTSESLIRVHVKQAGSGTAEATASFCQRPVEEDRLVLRRGIPEAVRI
jgi:hypothetical protein